MVPSGPNADTVADTSGTGSTARVTTDPLMVAPEGSVMLRSIMVSPANTEKKSTVTNEGLPL